MKISVPDNFRDDVKLLVDDYNAGVDHRDITEVEMAISGLVTLLFAGEPEVRQQAINCLVAVAGVQPGFLKKSLLVLQKRYRDPDPARSEMASVALEEIFLKTQAAPLITDPQLKAQLEQDAEQRRIRAEQAVAKEQAILLKKQKVEVDLSGLTGDVFIIGDYYNKSMVNDDEESAKEAVKRLINQIFLKYPQDFSWMTVLLGRMANPSIRAPFFPDVFKLLLQRYVSKKEEERQIAEEVLETIIDQVEDLLDPGLAEKIRLQAAQKAEERRKQVMAREERRKLLEKVTVEPSFRWDARVREAAERYNEAFEENNPKLLRSFKSELAKLVGDKDQKVRLDAAKLLKRVLVKNADVVRELVETLVRSSNKPEVSEVLGEMLEELQQLKMVDQAVYSRLYEEHMVREEERKRRKEELQRQIAEREKVRIAFDKDWEDRLVKLCEKFNDAHFKKKPKDAVKLVDEFEKYLYAEDAAIREQAAEIFKRIADKYPDYVLKALGKLVDLFTSEHEAREIASEDLGVIIDTVNRDKVFKAVPKEVQDRILEEREERKKKREEEELRKKWDAIKLDVTTIRINLEHKKFIQEICRRYNEAIKAQDRKKVVAEVKKIVDIVLHEKKQDVLDQGIEVLGKIALNNIELIAPTIQILLQWLGDKDEDKKRRAVQGLGEVAVARPGWAWEAIQRLIQTSKEDPDPDIRRKALLEVSRVGKKEAIMLIDFVDDLVSLLQDSDKHVRRMTAQVFCSMAEVIPREAKEAIPALTEALHDDYILVRKFADKALQLIRQAIRSM
ncbi:MAG: hypothetical protein Kow0069_28530 [Promethearchaeota archaeon]